MGRAGPLPSLLLDDVASVYNSTAKSVQHNAISATRSLYNGCIPRT